MKQKAKGYCIWLLLMSLFVTSCGSAGTAKETGQAAAGEITMEETTMEETTMEGTGISEESNRTEETGISEGTNRTEETDTAEQADRTEETDTAEQADRTEETGTTEQVPPAAAEEIVTQQAAVEDADRRGQHLVCIDAGHQRYGDSSPEPVGPGAADTKARVTGGTRGVATGQAEYELNLQVALKLQQELEGRGYAVLMVRSGNDVNISNSERAAVANNAAADAFIRIHANGSEDSGVSGAMTICQTPSNPYNGALYAQSRSLSENVLNYLTEAAGCRKGYVWETDSMSGINWCNVPVTIVEMGYLSNPQEDQLLAEKEYQSQIVTGIANGIDAFFGNTP